jgi:hypothetical protein
MSAGDRVEATLCAAIASADQTDGRAEFERTVTRQFIVDVGPRSNSNLSISVLGLVLATYLSTQESDSREVVLGFGCRRSKRHAKRGKRGKRILIIRPSCR